MDPHSFFGDPDPAVCLIVDPDPDPGAYKCGTGFCIKKLHNITLKRVLWS